MPRLFEKRGEDLASVAVVVDHEHQQVSKAGLCGGERGDEKGSGELASSPSAPAEGGARRTQIPALRLRWSPRPVRRVARPSVERRASPSPNPPWRRVLVPSAWRNRSKTCGRNSAEIPWPVSLTAISMWESTGRVVIRTFPSRGVNLMALETRFHTT